MFLVKRPIQLICLNSNSGPCHINSHTLNLDDKAIDRSSTNNSLFHTGIVPLTPES